MSTFWDFILFWLAYAATALAIPVGLMLVGLLFCIPGAVKKARCPHTEYRENRACHGICQRCTKDLGFIQPLRADKSKKEIV